MSSAGPDSVRLARTSDVDDIARVQVRAWRASYAGILPPEVLESLDESDIALEWGRALLRPGPDRLLVATDGSGAVVGAASIGPSGDPDAGDDPALAPGEVGLFVIDPDARRQGHGSRLLAACVDLLVQGGHFEAVTWVPLADEARRAFLQSAGWGPDSAYRDLAVTDDATVREVRIVSVLADPPGEAGHPDS